MHPYIYQNDGVQCNCFNNLVPAESSGLKPSRNFTSNVNPTFFHRATKSTESKVQKQQASKIRTSLRRQKPKTPNESRAHIQTAELQFQPVASSKQMPLLEQRKSDGNIRWGTTKPLSYQPNLQQFHQPVPLPPNLQPKRMNLVRNQIPKQNNQLFKIDFNSLQQYKVPEQIDRKVVKIMYNNPQLSQVKEPIHQLLQTQRTQRQDRTQRTERSEWRMQDTAVGDTSQNLRNSRESKKCSLRGSQRNERGSITPRPQPFRMVLKQIESVADENEAFDDQVSEVIGRGWQQDRDESFMQYHKEQRLHTETHATRASNIKNSSTIYSHYGITESHLRK